MGRAIVMTSGKGGVGKTTLTVTVGRILAASGKRVVLVDTDIGLNNVDVVLGVENYVVYDLVDVIENRCRASQALISVPDSKGLYVLPSVHSYEYSRVDGQSIRAVIAGLKNRFDFVLIDCPAGIEAGFHRAVSAADEAVVVTTPHLSAVKDAQKVLVLLKPYALGSVSIVVNRARGDREKTGEEVTARDVEELLGVRVIGVVPDDDAVGALSCTSEAPPRRSEGYKATEMLCRCITGSSDRVYDAAKKYGGVLGKIKRSLKKRL